MVHEVQLSRENAQLRRQLAEAGYLSFMLPGIPQRHVARPVAYFNAEALREVESGAQSGRWTRMNTS